jgi:N-acyl-phosphatidylethanolamine-hydrolysing phospholipase D
MNQLRRTMPFMRNDRFWNKEGESHHAVLLPSLKMLASTFRRAAHVVEQHWLAQPTFDSQDQLTWLGHASFHVVIDGVSCLLDPLFGHLPFFPRQTPLVQSHQFPAVDCIMISHNHMDHLDTTSLRQLAIWYPEALVLVPRGDEALVRSCGFRQVVGMMWWESLSYKNIRLHFLPTKHWSGRTPWSRNVSLWGSYLIEGPEATLYFGGDSAYWQHYKEIGQVFGDIDLALLPIGPCTPRNEMAHVHMDAHDAVRAFMDLKAEIFVPMHWGTYRFGMDQFDTPVRLLSTAWQEVGIRLVHKKLLVSKFGQTHEFASLY